MKRTISIVATLLVALAFPVITRAHCDSVDGPVVLDARAALEKKDLTPLLKWVRAEDESRIRAAFDRTITVRQLGPEAKALADTWFFETVVRIHREGEGASFDGLKPAGTIPAPIAAADRALATGAVDDLVKLLTEHAANGVRERFARALQAKAHATESVEAGRAYVEAYVAYVHYVEALVGVVHGAAHHQ